MTLPPRTCSNPECGIAIAYVWLTVADRILCLGCGTRSAIVIPVLTEAGHCVMPCDCQAEAEAGNARPLMTGLIYDEVGEEP